MSACSTGFKHLSVNRAAPPRGDARRTTRSARASRIREEARRLPWPPRARYSRHGTNIWTAAAGDTGSESPIGAGDSHSGVAVQSGGRPRAARGGYPLPREVEALLTPEECRHVIDLARGALEPSRVSAAGNVWGSTNAATRTSSSALLEHAALTSDAVLKRLGERLANLTDTPIEHQEPFQVVQYLPGQQFTPHFDAGKDLSTLWMGQRKTTVLLYLNTCIDGDGGTTTFPELDMHIQPKMGNALVFSNLDPITGGSGAQPHPLSLHSGDPLLSGEKWAVNLWIREKSYLPPPYLKYAFVVGYTLLWIGLVTSVAVVFHPPWLMP